MNESVYIGDGIYAAVEDGMVRLATYNGRHVTNAIFIEWDVWDRLVLLVNANRNEKPKHFSGTSETNEQTSN